MGMKPPPYVIGGETHEFLPERILGFGPPAAGKTQAWLSIADLYQQVGDPATFWVADADSAVLRSMSGTFSHLTNVDVTGVHEFREYAEWADRIAKSGEVRPGDWVVIDTASSAYTEAQDFYLKKRYGMDRVTYELEKMFDDDHKGPPIDPADWVMIRNLFLNWWERMIVRALSEVSEVNIFATAEAKQIMEHHEKKRDDKSDLIDYGPMGYRPDGHRSLPHKVHTVGMMKRTATKYFYVPVKDRQRSLSNVELSPSFAVAYLLQVAGWGVD